MRGSGQTEVVNMSGTEATCCICCKQIRAFGGKYTNPGSAGGPFCTES